MHIELTAWSRWLTATVAASLIAVTGCAGPATAPVDGDAMAPDAALADVAVADAIDAPPPDGETTDAPPPDGDPIDTAPLDSDPTDAAIDAPDRTDPLDPTAAPAQCADRPSEWPPPPPPPPPPTPHSSLTTFVNPAAPETVYLINTTSVPVGPIWFDGADWIEAPWSTARQGMTLGPNESVTVPHAIHVHTPGQSLDVPPLPPPAARALVPPGIDVATSRAAALLTSDAAPDPDVAWTAPIDLAYGAAISPAGRVAILDGPSRYPWPAGPAMLRVFDVDGTPILQRALAEQPMALTARGAGFAIATRGSVEALDGTGASLWRRTVPTMPSVRISGGPNGHVYVLGYTSNHYHLTAFGPDGALRWTRESPVPFEAAIAVGVDGLGLGVVSSAGLARWSPSGGETTTVAPTWPTGFPCGTFLPHGLVSDVQLLGDGGRVAVCYPYSAAGEITVRAIDDDGTVRGPDTTTTAAAFIGGGPVVYQFRSRCGGFGILTSEGVRSYDANGGRLLDRSLASIGISQIYADDSALRVHAGFDINAGGQMVIAASGRVVVTRP